MAQKYGTFLLAFTFIGLGVLHCAYPSELLERTRDYYSKFLPRILIDKLNVILGLSMFWTATSLLLKKSHAVWLVRFAIFFNVLLEGIPYIPTLNEGNQFPALIVLVKFISIFGGSLLIAS